MSDIRGEGPQGTPVDVAVTSKGAVHVVPIPSFLIPRQAPPGQTAAAYAAGDAVGIQWAVEAPFSCTLMSATFWDLSDQALQFNLTIAAWPYATVPADNAAFSLTDADARLNVYEVQFATFTDWVNNRMSSLENIGKLLKFPLGKAYLQLWTPAAPTTAAGALPEVQLEFYVDA